MYLVEITRVLRDPKNKFTCKVTHSDPIRPLDTKIVRGSTMTTGVKLIAPIPPENLGQKSKWFLPRLVK